MIKRSLSILIALVSIGLVSCSADSTVTLDDVLINIDHWVDSFDASGSIDEVEGCAYVMMLDLYEGKGVDAPYYLRGNKVAGVPRETIAVIEALHHSATGNDLSAQEIAKKYGKDNNVDVSSVLNVRMNCAKLVGELDRMQVTYQ